MMSIKCLGGPRDQEYLQVFGDISEPEVILRLHDGKGGLAEYKITDEFASAPAQLFAASPRIYVFAEPSIGAKK